jgi:hypothetical protein
VAPRAGRAPLGLVILCISPLATEADVLLTVGASLSAGNRTLVTYPAGATARVRRTVAGFARRMGDEHVSVVTTAGLLREPGAELGHLVSVNSSSVRREGSEFVVDAPCTTARSREALSRLFTTDFPVAEWNRRIDAPSAPADPCVGARPVVRASGRRP